VNNEWRDIGPVALDCSIVIHGDNLHALKALLPLYAGKVDCIFVDPPYNRGNEGWSSNDKREALAFLSEHFQWDEAERQPASWSWSTTVKPWKAL